MLRRLSVWSCILLCSLGSASARDCGPCTCYRGDYHGFCNFSLKNVSIMNCSGLHLDYIPYIIPEVEKVQLLDFSYNSIETFLNATKFRAVAIDLRGNNFTTLSTFEIPASLRYLDISDNDVDLTGGFTRNFVTLQFLKIDPQQLSNSNFSGLTSLHKLHITTSNNIPRSFFTNASFVDSLQELVIEADNIPVWLLQPFRKLEVLELILPTATQLPNDLFLWPGNETLNSLTIRATNLEFSGRHFLMKVMKLETLKLYLNDVNTLPYDFLYEKEAGKNGLKPQHSEKRFYLNDIFISGVGRIPALLLTYTPYLETLEITKSEVLPETLLKDSKSLTFLSLTHNHMEDIAAHFLSGQTTLHHLNLSYNELLAIGADEFTDVTELEVLDLSFNNISSVDTESFVKMSDSLKHLNLSNNKLCKLPSSVFHGMFSLQQMYLDSNCLEVILPDLLRDLSNLTHLHLQSNNIAFIPKESFTDLNSLELLSLSDNPLQCYCTNDILALLDMGTNSDGQCAEPTQLQHKPVWDLTEEEICLHVLPLSAYPSKGDLPDQNGENTSNAQIIPTEKNKMSQNQHKLGTASSRIGSENLKTLTGEEVLILSIVLPLMLLFLLSAVVCFLKCADPKLRPRVHCVLNVK